MKCKNCQSSQLVKNGYSGNGVQRFYCKKFKRCSVISLLL
ncbi:MAG: transposase-like zinc-binding domain-containing protein [Bacteroidota bacterium]